MILISDLIEGKHVTRTMSIMKVEILLQYFISISFECTLMLVSDHGTTTFYSEQLTHLAENINQINNSASTLGQKCHGRKFQSLCGEGLSLSQSPQEKYSPFCSKTQDSQKMKSWNFTSNNLTFETNSNCPNFQKLLLRLSRWKITERKSSTDV